MPNVRWLMTMEVQPDLDGPGMSYRLWLTELNEATPRETTLFHTIDALFAALIACCDQQASAERHQLLNHVPQATTSIPDAPPTQSGT